MIFKRVVAAIQVFALACAAIFVVMLFANQPSGSASAGPVDGAAIFATYCGQCHGAHGLGGIGPKLAEGTVALHFPDIEDEIAVVTNGRASMPAWKDRLSDEEIRAVVEYTRTL